MTTPKNFEADVVAIWGDAERCHQEAVELLAAAAVDAGLERGVEILRAHGLLNAPTAVCQMALAGMPCEVEL